ncbi:hypothetical protein Pcinc_038600 [Petrolisthes cinctipes]|uniref:GST C-terminal domain-containing protein n=1 Tax=Petrolisthes cinctipes TaxID=88211 RepID=A0AAE1EMV4_PETCI|nr:hypothetical protein Pcinc_038600 [Petrolisthes cinctipes]
MATTDSQLLPLVYSGLVSQKVKKSGEERDARASAMKERHKLNDYLRIHTFLVGERVSLADITMFATLIPAFQSGFDASEREKLACLTRWFNTILHQPQVAQVVGTISMK